jgi:hypothetical protein
MTCDDLLARTGPTQWPRWCSPCSPRGARSWLAPSEAGECCAGCMMDDSASKPRRRLPQLPTATATPMLLREGAGSTTRSAVADQRVIGSRRRLGMIAAVSLRLLYLIFLQILGLVLLMSRASSTEDLELLILRHLAA